MEVKSHLKMPPVRVLKSNGTSFYFASLIFNREQQARVAKLYQLCRYIDDCADELSKKESRYYLGQLKNLLAQQSLKPETDLSQLLTDVKSFGVRMDHLGHLLEGALFDLNEGKIETQKDLLLYCYRVAGVVGLMMCPLLGVRKKQASPFALDLGIAMQLTNICRDVLEDAQNKRSYLPQVSLDTAGLKITDLGTMGPTPKELKSLVQALLTLADHYYESGYKGLSYIPLRPRLCILVAGEVYRAIGKKLARNGYEVLKGRTYLGLGEKVWIVFKTIPQIFSSNFWSPKTHRAKNHTELLGLPGVNGKVSL